MCVCVCFYVATNKGMFGIYFKEEVQMVMSTYKVFHHYIINPYTSPNMVTGSSYMETHDLIMAFYLGQQ